MTKKLVPVPLFVRIPPIINVPVTLIPAVPVKLMFPLAMNIPFPPKDKLMLLPPTLIVLLKVDVLATPLTTALHNVELAVTSTMPAPKELAANVPPERMILPAKFVSALPTINEPDVFFTNVPEPVTLPVNVEKSLFAMSIVKVDVSLILITPFPDIRAKLELALILVVAAILVSPPKYPPLD